MSAPRLTKHQNETLLRLARLSKMARMEGAPGRWIHERDCGGPSALGHLYSKGYAEREVRRGTRGGEHVYYRPTAEGWAVHEKHLAMLRARRDDALRAERDAAWMPMGEVDTRLIEAKKNGDTVLVYLGDPASGMYVRGVPGKVARDENGVLNLSIGQRKIALRVISKVTA